MISEGSRDTEDWINEALITEINYILKYKNIVIIVIIKLNNI